jgi:hypothetical protein
MCSTINWCTNIICKRVAFLWVSNQATINLFISSQRCFVDSPLWFSLREILSSSSPPKQSQKVKYLFHTHWNPLSICNGSYASLATKIPLPCERHACEKKNSFVLEDVLLGGRVCILHFACFCLFIFSGICRNSAAALTLILFSSSAYGSVGSTSSFFMEERNV